MTITEVALLISSAGGVGGVAALISAVKNQKQSKEIVRQNKQINEQVTNDHDTNLRDDLDKVKAGVASINRKLDHVTGELHERIQAEGDERRMDVRVIHDHLGDLCRRSSPDTPPALISVDMQPPPDREDQT